MLPLADFGLRTVRVCNTSRLVFLALQTPTNVLNYLKENIDFER